VITVAAARTPKSMEMSLLVIVSRRKIAMLAWRNGYEKERAPKILIIIKECDGCH
jgi:hypothetical protein